MYLVKVIVQPTKPSDPSIRYSKTYYEGVFMPKMRECPLDKLKNQVRDYLERKLLETNPGLEFDFKITTNKLKDDFLVCEDKT